MFTTITGQVGLVSQSVFMQTAFLVSVTLPPPAPALSLLAMPATLFVIQMTFLPLPPLWFKVAVLIAACPTGVNAYLFATYFKVAEGLSSSVIVLSLLGSIITIPIWLALL